MGEEQEVQGKRSARPPYRKLSQKVGEERDKQARRGAVLTTGSPADQVPEWACRPILAISQHQTHSPRQGQEDLGNSPEETAERSPPAPLPNGVTLHYPTGPESWSSRLYLGCSWLVLFIDKLFQSSQGREERRLQMS